MHRQSTVDSTEDTYAYIIILLYTRVYVMIHRNLLQFFFVFGSCCSFSSVALRIRLSVFFNYMDSGSSGSGSGIGIVDSSSSESRMKTTENDFVF